MADKSKSLFTVLLTILVLAIVAGVGTYFLVKEPAPTTAPEATQEFVESPSPEVAPDEAPKTDVVVETKKLEGDKAVADQPVEIVHDPATDKYMETRGIGDPNAPIKVVEYSSLTCPHCALFHKDTLPKLKELYIDTGKVYMTFKEFPLNDAALNASAILRCMPADTYYNFMTLLFNDQEKWGHDEKYLDYLRQNAKLAGLGDADFDACLNNTNLKKRIVADQQIAQKKYSLSSTPSFVVNDGEKVIVGHQPITFFEETFNALAPKAAAPSAPIENVEPSPAE